jgi:hypothetical protein
MASTVCSKGASKEYYLNFIGNKKDFKDEAMFNIFDTDYINLDLLPYNYYPIHNKENYKKIISESNYGISSSSVSNPVYSKIIENIRNEIEVSYKKLENPGNHYNKYLITPITITIILIWVFVFLFVLKYIHYNYNILYIYLVSTIIILLLIFGSLWFLYVNSQLL